MSSKADRSSAQHSSQSARNLERTDHLSVDAAKVREARKVNLLTQEELAERAGVSKRTIENLECGRRAPSFKTVRKVAEALRIDPQMLMLERERTPVGAESLRNRRSDQAIETTSRNPTTSPILVEQLNVLRLVEQFFNVPNTHGIDFHFGFRELIEVNAARMYAEYATLKFRVHLKSKALKMRCPAADVHPDTPVFKCSGPLTKAELAAFRARHALKSWAEYFHWNVAIPARLFEAQVALGTLSNSPFLPVSVKDQVDDFRRIVWHNTKAVRETMNECAADMPRMYPQATSLKTFDISWIWNRYNPRCEDLNGASRGVLEAIREYLTSCTV